MYKCPDALIATLKKELGLDDNLCMKIQRTVLEPHKHLHRHANKKHHHGRLVLSNTQTTLSLSSNGDKKHLQEKHMTHNRNFNSHSFVVIEAEMSRNLKLFYSNLKLFYSILKLFYSNSV